MNNATVDAKAAKIASKEEKELELRKKQAARQFSKYYILVLMIVLTLAYLVDEVASNITKSLQSNIIYELFNVPLLNGSYDVNGTAYQTGIASYSVLSMCTIVIGFILPFYKALADKFGRKIFLVINTFFMGFGMLVIMLAPSFTVFAVGLFMVSFATPTDFHSLYIMEYAPPKHRVKITMGAKAVGILGISSIGLLRLIFLNSDVASWRNIYIIPVVLTLCVAFVILCITKETPYFVNSRLEYLEKSAEDRASEETEKKAKKTKTGVIAGAKFVFSHHQLRWLGIITLCFGIATVAPSYYNTIMASGGMSETQISLVVIIYPFIYSLATFLGGLISDKFGRKKMALAYCAMTTLSLIIFVIASNTIDNGVLVGIIYGFYVGGLWSAMDCIIYAMTQESSPTNLRASTMSVIFLMSTIGTLLALVCWMIFIKFFAYGIAAIILAVVGLGMSALLVATKIGETRNVDLNTVRGDEWDR